MQSQDPEPPQSAAASPHGPGEAVPTGTKRVYRGTGVAWALVTALIAAALLLILIAQNTASVVIHFFWFTPAVSLVVLVLGVAVLAVCLTELLGLVWRHRRRQRLTDRDELRRFHNTEN